MVFIYSIIPILIFFFKLANSAKIKIDLYYPAVNINSVYASNNNGIFLGFVITTCQTLGIVNNSMEFPTLQCPGGQYAFNSSYGLNYKTNLVGPNHWQKTFDLGNVYTGPVYVKPVGLQSIGVNSAGTLYTVSASINSCISDPAEYLITAEYCDQVGSPYVINVLSTSKVYSLPMYPFFGLQGGKSWVILPNFPSPQFKNAPYRNISVYAPPSILQNNVSRPVNIMLLMDGWPSVTSSFAFRGGFEQAILTGQVPMDTILLIGVPPDTNPYNVSTTPERSYELTPYSCNPKVTTQCNVYPPSNTGGAPILLQYIQQSVVPAVLLALGGFTRGEVSITGGSLGGLISLFAVTYNPSYFSRAWSMEGDVSYNFGQLASTIVQNYNNRSNPLTYKLKPKAVFSEIADAAYFTFTNPTSFQVLNQLDFQVSVDNAFMSIGVDRYQQSMTYSSANLPLNEYGYGTYGGNYGSNASLIATIYVQAGCHSSFTWETVFSAGLPMLYQPQWPDKYRMQQPLNFEYTTAAAPSSSSSGDSDSDSVTVSAGGFAGIIIAVWFVGMLFGAMVLMGINIWRKSNESGGLASKETLGNDQVADV